MQIRIIVYYANLQNEGYFLGEKRAQRLNGIYLTDQSRERYTTQVNQKKGKPNTKSCQINFSLTTLKRVFINVFARISSAAMILLHEGEIVSQWYL